jgi:hypothetical protein
MVGVIADRMLKAAGAWSEAKHPRLPDGKFKGTGGGSEHPLDIIAHMANAGASADAINTFAERAVGAGHSSSPHPAASDGHIQLISALGDGQIGKVGDSWVRARDRTTSGGLRVRDYEVEFAPREWQSVGPASSPTVTNTAEMAAAHRQVARYIARKTSSIEGKDFRDMTNAEKIRAGERIKGRALTAAELKTIRGS